MMAIFTQLADYVTLSLLSLDKGSRLQEAVHFFVEDITKIFTMLIIVVFIIGVIRGNLSPEKIKKWLETKGVVASHTLAVLFGAITPFCSCSSVPLFIGFIEAGIPLGATMSFLITSPMINEVAVVLLFSLLGFKFTMVYIAIGLLVGFFGGYLIHRLRLENWVQEYVYQIQAQSNASEPTHVSIQEKVAANFRYGLEQVQEIVGRIWPYVVIGIALGAFLHGYIPQETVVKYAGSGNPLAVPTAVLMGVPLYANVSATVPIAEALLAKGVQVGTAMAFMMSVAALSFPEMIILKKVLKVKMLLLFAAILAISFIISGYLLNWLF